METLLTQYEKTRSRESDGEHAWNAYLKNMEELKHAESKSFRISLRRLLAIRKGQGEVGKM